MRKYFTQYSSDSTGTRDNKTKITIGTNSPPCRLNGIPKINDIRKSATQYLIKSNKLDTSIDGNFTDNLVALPIFTEVICYKISDSSIRDLYTRFWTNLTADPVNIPGPKFVDLGLSTIGTLDKGASICNPATAFGRPTDVAHWSVPNHIFGKTTEVGDTVRKKSYSDYKTDSETWT